MVTSVGVNWVNRGQNMWVEVEIGSTVTRPQVQGICQLMWSLRLTMGPAKGLSRDNGVVLGHL